MVSTKNYGPVDKFTELTAEEAAHVGGGGSIWDYLGALFKDIVRVLTWPVGRPIV